MQGECWWWNKLMKFFMILAFSVLEEVHNIHFLAQTVHLHLMIAEWVCRKFFRILYLYFYLQIDEYSSTRREEILALKRILKWFQLASDLKVNMSEEATQALTYSIHCKPGWLLIMHIGLPIGAKLKWSLCGVQFFRKLFTWMISTYIQGEGSPWSTLACQHFQCITCCSLKCQKQWH